MKKLIYFSVVLVVLIAGIIFSCKKSSTILSDSDKSIPTAIAGAKATCACAGGQTSCNADCLFSDCCVCYDPKVSDGACACYWGLAICKSSKKATEARTAVLNKTIHFQPQRFADYLQYLESLRLNTTGLKGQYNKFDKTKSDISHDQLEITQTEFDDLYNSYNSFILTLDQINLARIKNYIDHQ